VVTTAFRRRCGNGASRSPFSAGGGSGADATDE
jgi:hypothetical protein